MFNFSLSLFVPSSHNSGKVRSTMLHNNKPKLNFEMNNQKEQGKKEGIITKGSLFVLFCVDFVLFYTVEYINIAKADFLCYFVLFYVIFAKSSLFVLFCVDFVLFCVVEDIISKSRLFVLFYVIFSKSSLFVLFCVDFVLFCVVEDIISKSSLFVLILCLFVLFCVILFYFVCF